MHPKPQHQIPSRRFFPFGDGYLQFFLHIFDDDEQIPFEGFKEEDDPFFNTLGFMGTLDNDLEEDFGLIEDKLNADNEHS